MKLRNKKSGEIGNLQPYGDDGRIWVWIGNISKPEYRYNSLAELNAEWEDYEEPKDHWYIDYEGDIMIVEALDYEPKIKEMKQIGNYFETREEAEKAVEKLKAWKRLKDKGFVFNGWNWKTQCIDYNLDYTDITEEQIEEAEKDLDLLFGGEE